MWFICTECINTNTEPQFIPESEESIDHVKFTSAAGMMRKSIRSNSHTDVVRYMTDVDFHTLKIKYGLSLWCKIRPPSLRSLAHKHWLRAAVSLQSVRSPRSSSLSVCLFVYSSLSHFPRVHLSVHLSAWVINGFFIRQMEGDGRKLQQEANQIEFVGGKDILDPNQLQWITRAQLIHRAQLDLGLEKLLPASNRLLLIAP